MSGVPAGWYDDPGAPGGLRWWDGSGWTHHTRAHPERPPAYAVPQGRPAPTGPTTADGEPLGGFWWRVLAYVLDTLFTLMVTTAVSLPSQVAVQDQVTDLRRELDRRVRQGEPPDFGRYFEGMMQAYADHAVGLFVVPGVVLLVAHVALLRWKGATPGKMIVGLRVRPLAAPGRLSWSSIARRLLAQFVLVQSVYVLLMLAGSFGLFVLGGFAAFGYVLVDDLMAARASRRALHDVVAGTVVVRTRD